MATHSRRKFTANSGRRHPITTGLVWLLIASSENNATEKRNNNYNITSNAFEIAVSQAIIGVGWKIFA